MVKTRFLASLAGSGLFLSAVFILWRTGLPDSPDFTVSTIEAPEVNNIAPLFTAQTLTGQTLSLGDARGYPVILNFWATWCEPCVAEMPVLDAVHQSGVDVVGINVGQETEARVRQWVEQANLSFPIVIDDQHRTLESKYRIRPLPTTFFIDRQGIIRHIVYGALDETSLRKGLESIGVE